METAELLGYGDGKAFKPMYDQIDVIVKKTEDGKSLASQAGLWGIFSV